MRYLMWMKPPVPWALVHPQGTHCSLFLCMLFCYWLLLWVVMYICTNLTLPLSHSMSRLNWIVLTRTRCLHEQERVLINSEKTVLVGRSHGQRQRAHAQGATPNRKWLELLRFRRRWAKPRPSRSVQSRKGAKDLGQVRKSARETREK